MRVWQADFYRRPFKDERQQVIWELLICNVWGTFRYSASCPQSEANATWLVGQLQRAALADKGNPENLAYPTVIQVFRPQSLGLIEAASRQLGIATEPNRGTDALKQWLQEKAQEYASSRDGNEEFYDPLALEKPPPMPLPEQLWGEVWRFAAIAAGDIYDAFASKPIPVLEMPEILLPLNLGVASTVPIPGVVINGGRQSMRLATWVQQVRPAALNYIPGAPDGLILEAGLADRWIVATFEDEEVAGAAKTYERRKQLSQGLHFLLVQPDDSGMTYSGFWLLREN